VRLDKQKGRGLLDHTTQGLKQEKGLTLTVPREKGGGKKKKETEIPGNGHPPWRVTS